jgi:hypothetical protein
VSSNRHLAQRQANETGKPVALLRHGWNPRHGMQIVPLAEVDRHPTYDLVKVFRPQRSTPTPEEP